MMNRVYIHHARAVLNANGRGYCAPGMRKFAERHNLDFHDFVKNGIDAEILIATGDAMALRIVEEAQKDGWRR